MTDAREKILDILDADRKWPDAPETADAILTAMPEILQAMVKPLVWCEFVSAPYEISEKDDGTVHLFNHAAHDDDWNPEYIEGGYLTLVSVDDLKEAAQDHHAAQIMAALGLEVKQ